jgi:predicted permease
MSMFRNDVRYALRLMRRSPGFTSVAVLSLALGIGANTAIFSLVNTVILQKLPVEQPGQLVELLQKYPGEPRGGYWSRESYEHFRDHNHVFSALTTTGIDRQLRVQIGDSEPEVLVAENVPGNYFPMLGLKPAIGRLLGPEDVPANALGNVAVLSWAYWTNRFNRDPGILGKRVLMQDRPLTIIGVAPREYKGLQPGIPTDIWIPEETGGGAMVGRLKPGVTVEQARAEAGILFRFTIEERAASDKDSLVRQLKVEVEPASAGLSRVRDRFAKPLILLMGVVGLLLMLACINIASLLLARAAARRREMAVRMGLGASRGQVLRQMLTESVLFSGAGTIVGIVLAYFGVDVLVRIMASGRLHENITIQVEPDIRLLIFTVAIAILTGLLFGVAPGWHAVRTAPASSLQQMGRTAETRSWRLFGRSLVVTQVALSVVLLTAAAIFLGHLSRLRNLDLGFRRDHVLLVQLDPARTGYKREQLVQPYQQLIARLEAIPGVRSASITGCTPIQGCGASRFVSAEGHVERPEDRRFTALSWVAPKYFETLGTPLLAGRDFSVEDAGRARVAIISQSMAGHYFPNANPIGKHITIDRDQRYGGWHGSDQAYEVVGVVGDVKQSELREPAPRLMYFNMFQENRLSHQFVLRTSVAPSSVAAEARRAVRDVLRTVPITRVTTLSEQVDAAIVPERLIGALSGYFGVLGAVLAGIGLYGLLAYTVTRRVNEIGVRMALGATATAMTRMVLAEALAMVCVGLALAVPLILWSRPFVSRMLQELEPASITPIAFGTAVALAVTMLASYVPARRAASVDPMEALRHE